MVHTIQRIIEDTAILTKIVRGTTRKDVHTIALTKFEQLLERTLMPALMYWIFYGKVRHQCGIAALCHIREGARVLIFRRPAIILRESRYSRLFKNR